VLQGVTACYKQILNLKSAVCCSLLQCVAVSARYAFKRVVEDADKGGRHEMQRRDVKTRCKKDDTAQQFLAICYLVCISSLHLVFASRVCHLCWLSQEQDLVLSERGRERMGSSKSGRERENRSEKARTFERESRGERERDRKRKRVNARATDRARDRYSARETARERVLVRV